MMRMRLMMGLAILATAGTVGAAPISVEPDDYPDFTVMNNVDSGVSLFTSVNANDLTGNFGFNVTSRTNNFPSTGTRVFAHANVPFFTTSRNLRMTFTDPVSFLGLDFIGSSNFFDEGPIFRIYDANETLLDETTLPSLDAGVVETLSFNRPQGDIKFAVASGDSGFIRLDNLLYEVQPQFEPVPEPASMLVWCALGCVGGVYGLRRRRLAEA